MLAGARRFNGGVERQQVGLFGQIVDDLDDLADVVGTPAQSGDDLARRLDSHVNAAEAVGGLVHSGDAVLHFLARAVRNIEQHLGSIGHALDRSHHLVDGSGSFAYAGSLRLRVLHHVLHVDAHLVHSAGDFIDRRRSLHADFGRFLGSVGHLIGAAGYLRGAVAHALHHAAQALGHGGKSVHESVTLGARLDGHGQVAAGDGFGNRGHLLQVSDHVVEVLGQLADLVVAFDINVLVQVAGLADLFGNDHQLE